MDADDIDERLADLYGRVDWSACTGLIQVVAVAVPGDRVIAIGEAAPTSATDRFVLGAARARADAVLTTGAILRAEADLRHRYAEDPEREEAFAAWRRERLEKDRRPALIVMSGSGELPPDHPAIADAERGLVWTSAEGRDRLGGRVGALEVVVAEREAGGASGLGALARVFRARFGAEATLSVEAGPSTSAALYAPAGPRLDELLLSRFHGELATAAQGPAFVPAEDIASLFPDPPSERRIEEPSGPWSFLRYRREGP